MLGSPESRKAQGAEEGKGIIRKVYMVGDNPESDIAGGNGYRSPWGSEWDTVLVRSGVYGGGEPAHRPNVVVDDVWDAVQWALEKEGWLEGNTKLEVSEATGKKVDGEWLTLGSRVPVKG